MMSSSEIYTAKGNYDLIPSVISAERCAEIVDVLEDSDDWSIAQVTDNGKAYMVMPTIRRQKIIERDDAEEETLPILEEVERLAIQRAIEEGHSADDIEVAVSQLIRSDVADFFIWHADSKPHLSRIRSYIFAFNEDYIGGDIEFWTNQTDDPVMNRLSTGDCLSYNSLVHSRHHKVLRGSSFFALVIIARNEKAQKAYEEEQKAKEEDSTS
jgi:hypothetical protein